MNDEVVLVTGGAGNLGQAVTRAFLESGARVVVPVYKTDRAGSVDALKHQFGDRFHTFALDLTTERGAEQAVRQTVEWGGRISSVTHLVGGYAGGVRLAGTPLEMWNRMVDLNMTSAYLISRFSIPQIISSGGGSLVFVSSRAALEGRSNRAAYAATKAGLISMAQAVAEEYGAEGVRSNVVVPDTIDTEDNRLAMPDADFTRFIAPESIARVIVFLASRASSSINGAVVPVYGAS